MKIGAQLLRVAPAQWVEVAQAAEGAGFESVWLPEHLVFPREIKSPFPMSPDGVAPIRPHVPVFDPLTVLAAIGATTTRIRLGTGVYLLPLRHPLSTARIVATLDILTGGRVSLAVAIGWMKEEFDAAGVDFRARASRMEECVMAMRALWTEASPAFRGKHFEFGDIFFEPKPVQKPHPPILLGGEAPGALRRAARLGDGWFGSGHDAAEAADLVRHLHEVRKEQGANGPFEITVSPDTPFPDPRQIEDYERAGVDRLLVHVAGFSQRRKGEFGPEAEEAMLRWGDEVVRKVQGPV